MDENDFPTGLQPPKETDIFPLLLTYIDLLVCQLHSTGAINGHELVAALRQRAVPPQPAGLAYLFEKCSQGLEQALMAIPRRQ